MTLTPPWGPTRESARLAHEGVNAGLVVGQVGHTETHLEQGEQDGDDLEGRAEPGEGATHELQAGKNGQRHEAAWTRQMTSGVKRPLPPRDPHKTVSWTTLV